MGITSVLGVTLTFIIIDPNVTVNVTLSLSPRTWYESQKSCSIINHSTFVPNETLHWMPRPPYFPSQVWIGGESRLSQRMIWIHFAGCFKGNFVTTPKFERLTEPDAISNCFKHCKNEQFYVTRNYCICDNNTTLLSTNEPCTPKVCSGTKGGYCGQYIGTKSCLCQYKHSRISQSQSCSYMDGFRCEKCMDDGRFICAQRQPSKFTRPNIGKIEKQIKPEFTRSNDDRPGFTCAGKILTFDADLPREDITGITLVYPLYGFLSHVSYSHDTEFCLALNITNTSTSLIERHCGCALNALCLYNGSLIGQAGQRTEDGLSPGVVVTVGVLAILLTVVCVGLWKYKRNEIRLKFGNCINTSELCLGCRSVFLQRPSERDPASRSDGHRAPASRSGGHRSPASRSDGHRAPDGYLTGSLPPHHAESTTQGCIDYQPPTDDVYDVRKCGRLSRDHQGEPYNDQEGHYDSTRGGENGGMYDYLGQMDAQQRTEQRLIGDYDTMTAVRAELGTDVTLTSLLNKKLTHSPGGAPETDTV